jgi:phosphatidylglycerol:prolipoprotein diacylglycerol transferase
VRQVLLHVDSLGLLIRSHLVFLTLAFLLPFAVGPWWAERLDRIPKWTTLRALVPCILGAAAGGNLLYTTSSPDLAAAVPGGMPWTQLYAAGSIFGVLVAAPFAFLLAGVHPGRMADALMPISGLSVAVARMGCFLNGCCFGIRCSRLWCLSYPPDAGAAKHHAKAKLIAYGDWSLPVHPLPLYFAAVGLLITVVSLWLLPRRSYRGQVALVALLIFSLGTYFIEPLRENMFRFRPYWGDEPLHQVMARFLVWTSVGALLTCEIGHRLLRLLPRRNAASSVTS